MTKQTWARIGGWLQLVIVYFNDALSANGGVIPTSKAAWGRLASSFLLALAVHKAAATSDNHPDGANSPAKGVLSVLLCFALVMPMTGCTSLSALDTVIADLPVATDIALSAVNIYVAFDGGKNENITAEIQEYSGEVSSDLKLLQALLQEYKASPSDSLLQRADAAVGAAQNHLTVLLAAFHVTDARTQAAAAAAVSLVRAVLADAAKLVPAGKSGMTPQAVSIAQGPVETQKPKSLAKKFNTRMQTLGFRVQVSVPR